MNYYQPSDLTPPFQRRKLSCAVDQCLNWTIQDQIDALLVKLWELPEDSDSLSIELLIERNTIISKIATLMDRKLFEETELTNLRDSIHTQDEMIITFLLKNKWYIRKLRKQWWRDFHKFISDARKDDDTSNSDSFYSQLVHKLKWRFWEVRDVWRIKKARDINAHQPWVWDDKIQRLKIYYLEQWWDLSQWFIVEEFFDAIHEEAIRIEKEIMGS